MTFGSGLPFLVMVLLVFCPPFAQMDATMHFFSLIRILTADLRAN